MTRKTLFAGGAFVASILLFAIAPASAQQKITPNHVYQAVQESILELELLHDANFTKANSSVSADGLAPRLPRHVAQKAIDVLSRVQLLRHINGLAEKAVPPLPLREITPGEVLILVTRLRDDLRALKPVFGVEKKAKAVPVPQGKKPTHVYAALLTAGTMVQKLGLPPVVPNDVVRTALRVTGDMERLRAKLGKAGEVEEVRGSKRKKPSHVYKLGYDLLTQIKALTENDAFGIPKGVIMPKEKTGKITPGDVQDILGSVLAELSSIKAKVGVTDPTPTPPVQGGKTPSSAFDTVSTAVVMLETLQ